MNAHKPLALLAAVGAAATALLVGPAAHADTSLVRPPAPASAATITEAELRDAAESGGLLLKPYKSRFRTSLPMGKRHDYRYEAPVGYWSVVAATRRRPATSTSGSSTTWRAPSCSARARSRPG